jgi:membrane associated rhomboid family serine protease
MTLYILALIVLTSLIALNNHKILNAMMLNPYLVETKKEYYRFISSGFVHAGYLHLFVNCLTLYFFGPYVESTLGSYHLLAILFLGIIISDFPTYAKYRHDPSYRSLGASGGIASVVFTYILISPVSTIYIFFIPLPAFVFGGLFLIYSYYLSKQNSGDHINHSAHFYGAVTGIVYTLIFYPEVLIPFFEQLLSWRLEF